jgi:tetratricopeptide (TPR) repeat protein
MIICPENHSFRKNSELIDSQPGYLFSMPPAVILFACLLLSQTAMASTFSIYKTIYQTEAGVLVPGPAVEREITAGEAHSYLITLTSGQYLDLTVEQLGINVVVKLYGPDGLQLIEANTNRTMQGLERVRSIAGPQGQYLLDIRPVDKNAQSGRYRIKIETLREATEQDKKRVAAEKLYAEAILLHVQSTAESLREAINKYESALLLFRSLGERRKEGLALVNIGQLYSTLSDWQKAIQYASEALTVFRSLGDRRSEAIALREIGIAYHRLVDLQKALDYVSEALQLSRSAGDAFGEAAALNTIGNLYSDLGEMQKSLEYYNQALSIFQKLGDRRSEAMVLTNIGNTYQLLSQPEEGLRYSFQALEIQRAIGDRRGEGSTLHNIGSFYYDLGELERALEFSNRALELRTAAGDRRGSAITLIDIATIYTDLHRYQEAVEYATRALEQSRSISDPRGEAFALNIIGRIYQALGQAEKAAEHYIRAAAIRRSIGNRQTEAVSLNDLGLAYRALGEVQKAHDSHSQAMALAREVGDRSGEAAALLGLARIELDRGNFTEARTHSQNALDIIESLRTKVVSPELRASYLATNQEAYKFHIDLLMRLHAGHPSEGHDREALKALERTRARSLLEILSEARANIRLGVEPQLLERERALQQKLNVKAERLTQLPGGKEAKERAAAEKELDLLLTEYQQVQAEIRANSPHYAALTQPQPLGLREIQAEVLDPDTLLLEYSLGEEHSFLWAVTATSIASYVLPKRAEIEAATRKVYDLLTARNRRITGETPRQRLARVARAGAEYPRAATALSRMLLGPDAARPCCGAVGNEAVARCRRRRVAVHTIWLSTCPGSR